MLKVLINGISKTSRLLRRPRDLHTGYDKDIGKCGKSLIVQNILAKLVTEIGTCWSWLLQVVMSPPIHKVFISKIKLLRRIELTFPLNSRYKTLYGSIWHNTIGTLMQSLSNENEVQGVTAMFYSK